MTQPMQHVIAAPLALAVRRMPPSVLAGTSAVTLHRPGIGSPEWRWEAGSGAGRVQLSALGADTTALVVAEEPGSAAGLADALTVELYGALERTWAPAVPRSQRTPMRPVRKIALAAAVLLVPFLAVTGMRVLAPPKALGVAAAVQQFREQDATQAAQPAGRAASDRQGATPAKSTATPRANGSRAGAENETAGDQVSQHQVSVASRPAARSDRATGSAAATKSSGDKSGGASQQPAPRQRSSDTTPTGIPDEGVYRYATEGHESIDRPASRHDYPSETAMSIRNSDCGFTAHWQPLENRWDEMDVCRAGGESFLPRISTHREFYGQENDSDYQCSADNYAYRPEPGATWAGSCSDGPAKMQVRGRTLGIESIRVGDETVETVHYTLQARISGGDAEGTWTADRWVNPDTGILVQLEAQTNATSDSSVGTVNYREELSLRLLSMTPQR